MVSQKVTSVDLVELNKMDFGIILDIDCLHSCYASVDYRNIIVHFQFPNKSVLECRGSTTAFRGQLISYLRARKMISKGCVYYLV